MFEQQNKFVKTDRPDVSNLIESDAACPVQSVDSPLTAGAKSHTNGGFISLMVFLSGVFLIVFCLAVNKLLSQESTIKQLHDDNNQLLSRLYTERDARVGILKSQIDQLRYQMDAKDRTIRDLQQKIDDAGSKGIANKSATKPSTQSKTVVLPDTVSIKILSKTDDADESALSNFVKQLESRIRGRWHHFDTYSHGPIKIRFTVLPSGVVSGPRLIHRSGIDEADQVALEAVRSSMYWGNPYDFSSANLELEATFGGHDNSQSSPGNDGVGGRGSSGAG